MAFVVLAIGGCERESEKTQEEKIVKGFPDGTYTCEVINITASNGPYALACDKSGDTVIVHFPNGGHISGGLVGATEELIEFSANDSRSNEWYIKISR